MISIYFVTANGSCVLEYRGEDGLNIIVVGWRGTHSVRVYVPVNDCVHFLRLLGGDVSKFGELLDTRLLNFVIF